MKRKVPAGLLVGAALGALVSGTASGALQVTEFFTGTTTTNSWYFYNGACLTASSASPGANPGQIPGCTAIKSSYYATTSDGAQSLVGGQNGVTGTADTLPDPTGSGALRFTNGYPYGHSQNGAIISATPFSSSAGVLATFKTATYRGDSGGSGNDGADGISFFLMDGSYPPGIGSWGGSLGYTCSNSNPPYDGIVGAYLGLGIDEFGNFLNQSDTTATGFGYAPNRIGLRGAGSISWAALNASYPTYYPSSLTSSQRQSAVQKTCSTGQLWNYSSNASSPTAVLSASGSTVSGTVAGTLSNGSNQITAIPLPFPSSLVVGAKITDPSGYIPAGTTVTNISTASSGYYGGTTTGVLTLSASPTVPSSGGWRGGGSTTANETMTYTVTAPGNPVTIADYAPLPGAYAVLSGVQIANEAAMSRTLANYIYYRLKITPDGYLSLSYSLNGAAYQNVIANQLITTANGPLPSTFRFGFGGSTGGDTNIHELLCFQAQPSETSGSSTSVNEKQAAKVQAGTQAYFAFYNPSDWTGALTANTLIDTNGVISIAPVANWDASCALSGVASGKTCGGTNASGPIAGLAPSARTILTWNGTKGVPFEWANITAAQQAALTAGDSSPTSDRLNFLRGDDTHEVDSAGVGYYRNRDSVLGDIVDSSPTWVGPPLSPYTASWTDLLNSGATAPEASGQSYLSFVGAQQTRLNVVYGGANDGYLHGFRAGSFTAAGAFSNTSATPNDGVEVLAYMPAAVVAAIHSSTTPAIDYSNPQYGHAFFVDATPGSGDLYYNSAWHTWLVGGLGAGGAGLYALDVTNPANFSEANAASVVIGEWGPSTITCVNVTSCGKNMGNTYGAPQIRRFHNGQWGVIFGNGLGSTSGDAGIYIMLVNPSSGAQTFYYLSTGSASSNGIAAVAPADLDGDHITDYIYAGDVNGNLWRFDVTSSNPSSWAVSTGPLFTAQSGQPIMTAPVIASVPVGGGAPRLMISFGTGRQFPLTNSTGTTYASASQNLYGVWDWNMASWNSKSTLTYASLASTAAATGLTSPSYAVTQAKLQSQPVTVDAITGARIGSANTICWQGGSCSAGTGKFGWYVNLPGTQEQVIYNPVLYQSAFIVDSVVPATNLPSSCTQSSNTGYTYAISVGDGSAFTTPFTKYNTLANVAGVQTDATGTPAIVTTAEATTSLVYQTVSGTPSAQQISLKSKNSVRRLTWVELR